MLEHSILDIQNISLTKDCLLCICSKLKKNIRLAEALEFLLKLLNLASRSLQSQHPGIRNPSHPELQRTVRPAWATRTVTQKWGGDTEEMAQKLSMLTTFAEDPRLCSQQQYLWGSS